MYNNFRGKKLTTQYEREQTYIAQYLVGRYEGISKIEFGELSENSMTGSHTTTVTVNETSKIDVTFYEFGKKEYVLGWNPNSFDLIEREQMDDSVSLESVEIIYWKKV